eukprot:325731-Pleurochrysis_carterae.AAC.1
MSACARRVTAAGCQARARLSRAVSALVGSEARRVCRRERRATVSASAPDSCVGAARGVSAARGACRREASPAGHSPCESSAAKVEARVTGRARQGEVRARARSCAAARARVAARVAEWGTRCRRARRPSSSSPKISCVKASSSALSTTHQIHQTRAEMRTTSTRARATGCRPAPPRRQRPSPTRMLLPSATPALHSSLPSPRMHPPRGIAITRTSPPR